MSSFSSREFRDLGRALIEETKESLGQSAAETGGQSAAVGASAPGVGASRSTRAFRAERTAGHAAAIAVGASGVVKEIAKICGKAGAAGAVVDGAVGGIKAVDYVRSGEIDGVQAAKHVGAEAGCGFVTSSTGTAGTLAVFMLTGKMGPAALVAGMGASMGSRYLYREVVGETLPEDEPGADRGVGDVEDIGPSARAEPGQPDGMEDIGPGATPSDPEADGGSPREEGETDADPDSSPSQTDGGVDASDDGDPSETDPWEDIGPAQ
ncbi:MAG: hypothetical protein ABEL76_00500 [Bradymonadaceae bacterium]